MHIESTESFAEDSESGTDQRNKMSGQQQPSTSSVKVKRVGTYANTENNAEGGGMDEATVMERLVEEGLVSEEEREYYDLRRNMIDFCEKMGRYGTTVKDNIVHIMRKCNPLCVDLVPIEALNKLMKDKLTLPRSGIKIIEPDDKDISKLSDSKKEIYKDFSEETKDYVLFVIDLIDEFNSRLKTAFEAIDESLKENYHDRFWLTYATSLKTKADFQRYYAETLSGEERLKVATESQKNYELVYEGYKNIPNGENSAHALSCQLNLCVLLCDIFGDTRKAIDKANAVLDDASIKMNIDDYQTKKFHTVILQLIRENVTIWQLQLNEIEGNNKVKSEHSNEENKAETTTDDVAVDEVQSKVSEMHVENKLPVE